MHEEGAGEPAQGSTERPCDAVRGVAPVPVGGHEQQALAPGASLKAPATQATHAPELLSPDELLYRPTPQAVHAVAPLAE